MISLPYVALAAVGIFAGGVFTGMRYHAGQDAIAEQEAAEARETDAKQQRRFNDTAAGKHAAALATLNTKLRGAYERIGQLDNRACLDSDTVSMLNAIGAEPVRAPASEPDAAPAAVATNRDTARALAECRSGYTALSSQLNQIIDIEERRRAVTPRGR